MFQNSSVITNEAGALFQMQGTVSMNNESGASRFDNAGTLQTLGGGGVATFGLDMMFNNYGGAMDICPAPPVQLMMLSAIILSLPLRDRSEENPQGCLYRAFREEDLCPIRRDNGELVLKDLDSKIPPSERTKTAQSFGIAEVGPLGQ